MLDRLNLLSQDQRIGNFIHDTGLVFAAIFFLMGLWYSRAAVGEEAMA